ncbi:MAG: hypothetical protein GXP26_16540 [Planctomycetes bacterium]|nr:hypothetical protein [Planctomycetota bacterium]
MSDKSMNPTLFAFSFLVAIPAVVHGLFEGAYQPDNLGTFWIGPISTTAPYVFLALLFLAHYPKSQRSAYCGASMAWLSMMAFTVFLISQTPGPKISSTMGIAVGMTPIIYIPFLVLPYIGGAIVGWLWKKMEEKRQ